MRPPCPPSPERSAELRRRFAEEARSERPDLSTLCLLVGAEADGELDEAGLDAAQVELDRLAGLLPYRPGGPRAWAVALRELLGERIRVPRQRRPTTSGWSPRCCTRCWCGGGGCRSCCRWCGWRWPGGRGRRCTGWLCRGTSWSGSGRTRSRCSRTRSTGGGCWPGRTRSCWSPGRRGRRSMPSMLRPADPLDVVLRILNNVRAWAAARPERSDVSLWAVELSLLLPSHPARLRYERAQLLVQTGGFRAGGLGVGGLRGRRRGGG